MRGLGTNPVARRFAFRSAGLDYEVVDRDGRAVTRAIPMRDAAALAEDLNAAVLGGPFRLENALVQMGDTYH